MIFTIAISECANWANLAWTCSVVLLIFFSRDLNGINLTQGHSMLDTASQICPSNDVVQTIQNEVLSDNMPGHQAIVHGAVCAALGIDEVSALTMFMYSVLKTVVAASVKLGKIGTMQVTDVCIWLFLYLMSYLNPLRPQSDIRLQHLM